MRRTTILLALLGVQRQALGDETRVDPGTTGAAWSPYVVGALIGILTWLTFYFSDKPLGASTAYARVAGLIGKAIAPRTPRRSSITRRRSRKWIGR